MSVSREPSCIYSAVRTPIGKFHGALSLLPAPDLAAVAVREALKRSGVPGDEIHEVILGNVLSAGLGQAPARQAAIKAGIAHHIGATTINKVCGSGLKAVMMADQAIRSNEADFVIAGGMENMSQAPYLIPQLRRGHRLGNTQLIDSMLHDGLWDAQEDAHMGNLSEKIAREFCFSRESQDAYAVTSYTRARKAQEDGIFAREIIGVEVPHRGKGIELVVRDEEPFSVDLDGFSFLRPVFDRKSGTITKGNGAKLNDGAAALVIGREIPGRPPLAKIIGYATHAQSPATFALAPVGAVKKVLKKYGLTSDDVDLFEINEPFAVVSLAINELLELDPAKVNVHGGAIALGHPIGATGARILVTLLNALQERNLKRGVASLCIGGGEAIALVVERM